MVHVGEDEITKAGCQPLCVFLIRTMHVKEGKDEGNDENRRVGWGRVWLLRT